MAMQKVARWQAATRDPSSDLSRSMNIGENRSVLKACVLCLRWRSMALLRDNRQQEQLDGGCHTIGYKSADILMRCVHFTAK